MARTSKGFSADSRASTGQNKCKTRKFEGQKKTNKDKPRTRRGPIKTCERQPPRESAILLIIDCKVNSKSFI